MEDDPLVAALEAGLKANPNHVGLLVQLATQLKTSLDHAPRALDLVEKAITLEPRNMALLELAREIAVDLGKDHIAASYAILLRTLDNFTPETGAPKPFTLISNNDVPETKKRSKKNHLKLVVDTDIV